MSFCEWLHVGSAVCVHSKTISIIWAPHNRRQLFKRLDLYLNSLYATKSYKYKLQFSHKTCTSTIHALNHYPLQLYLLDFKVYFEQQSRKLSSRFESTFLIEFDYFDLLSSENILPRSAGPDELLYRKMR